MIWIEIVVHITSLENNIAPKYLGHSIKCCMNWVKIKICYKIRESWLFFLFVTKIPVVVEQFENLIGIMICRNHWVNRKYSFRFQQDNVLLSFSLVRSHNRSKHKSGWKPELIWCKSVHYISFLYVECFFWSKWIFTISLFMPLTCAVKCYSWQKLIEVLGTVYLH